MCRLLVPARPRPPLPAPAPPLPPYDMHVAPQVLRCVQRHTGIRELRVSFDALPAAAPPSWAKGFEGGPHPQAERRRPPEYAEYADVSFLGNVLSHLSRCVRGAVHCVCGGGGERGALCTCPEGPYTAAGGGRGQGPPGRVDEVRWAMGGGVMHACVHACALRCVGRRSRCRYAFACTGGTRVGRPQVWRLPLAPPPPTPTPTHASPHPRCNRYRLERLSLSQYSTHSPASALVRQISVNAPALRELGLTGVRTQPRSEYWGDAVSGRAQAGCWWRCGRPRPGPEPLTD